MRGFRRTFALALSLVLSIVASSCNSGAGLDSGSASRPAPPAAMNRSAVPAEPDSQSGESYARVHDNPYVDASITPVSTFSIDVDTASYSNVRRFLADGQLPPPDAVRVEEFVNYFTYDYPQPDGDVPFSVTSELAECPWNAKNHLLRLGLKGRDAGSEQLPAANLVFLIDTSGSMESDDKLPLLKSCLRILVDQLRPEDRVAIVTYAGTSGRALAPTRGDRKAEIMAAVDNLGAGGSTNGGAGIELAYETAVEGFLPGGINRVILATDGDFNVGVTSESELVALIEQKRKSGVFLSVVGLGKGNLQDSKMERLADLGNGNYAYIDSIGEGRRLFGRELTGTLHTIAKDVKIQVEFNRAAVARYRLVGYENRVLANRDFADDAKDAGEIGAGHTVTAMYEIEPAESAPRVGELANVQLRYKPPSSDESRLLRLAVAGGPQPLGASSNDFRFAAAVAEFGMVLRQSPYAGDSSFEEAISLATSGRGPDLDGRRAEFLMLAARASSLRR
jgi:Ca-activated chloride channel family protein